MKLTVRYLRRLNQWVIDAPCGPIYCDTKQQVQEELEALNATAYAYA